MSGAGRDRENPTPLGREWVNIHPCWVSGTGWGKQNLILARPVAMRSSLSTHLSFT